jgi:hypothetical protein
MHHISGRQIKLVVEVPSGAEKSRSQENAGLT